MMKLNWSYETKGPFAREFPLDTLYEIWIDLFGPSARKLSELSSVHKDLLELFRLDAYGPSAT